MNFPGHHGRPAYDLSQVEQNDLVQVRLGHTIFPAIVTATPGTDSLDCIDRHGVRMLVPASLVLGHTERTVRVEGRAAA